MPLMVNRRRVGRFFGIGLLGFTLQIAALWALSSLAAWPWLPATLAAVELAIIHNFLWHERWTWSDRLTRSRGLTRSARSSQSSQRVLFSSRAPRALRESGARFARFHLSNGLASIAGNAALMALFVGVCGWHPVASNTLAVVIISIANFQFADRWVFAVRGATVALVAGLVLAPRGLEARATAERAEIAELVAAGSAVSAVALASRVGPRNQPDTVAAWLRYVARAEARLQPNRAWTSRAAAEGGSVGVPSGTISDWHGSVFIKGITLDHLLHRLQHPGTPPPQEDVVSSRLLSRGEDSLRVYIRLVRSLIVSVTYDTEHEMTFRRWSPTVATARSVATRIEEVGGGDRGFLWRLHSYWRYEQRPGGVLVELDSLALSRSVPALVRPVASPLVNKIARESTERTLDALRRYLERG